jgi:integrase
VRGHLDHCRLRNLRPGTIYQRGRALVRLRRALDGPELLDVDHEVMAGWYSALDLTPEARATELSHVRTFYRWALLEGLIESDPTLRLVRPRIPRRIPRPIGDDDLARALEGAPERVRPWLFLAAYSGLRACEIAGLRRRDVLDDADPPVIVVTDGKGGKQRVVPLAARVLAELRVSGLPPSGWLFSRADGKPGPLKPWSISGHANRSLRELGIPATLHQLRHHFGTSLYRSTHDLRLTQEVMGHASPVTTAGYAAWSPTEAAVAVEALAR